MQPRVLERIGPLRDQCPGGEQIVLIQLGGVEDQDPEAGPGGRDRKLEGLCVVRERPDLDYGAVLAE